MGAKHSKPRIRRNRRFSSLQKRQAPEGSNDPGPSPSEAASCGSNTKRGLDEGCQYCGAEEGCKNLSREVHTTKVVDDVTKGKMPKDGKKLFCEDFIEQVGLKVDLPPRSPVCCRSCVAKEKSKSLPSRCSLQNCNKQTDKEAEEEQDWTITLYEIDKMSGRVPREDMVRLMSSIFDAVDAKVTDSPQGRKTVRVRLSVTPERGCQTKLLRTSSTPHKERSDYRCSNCPNTEPTSRRALNDSKPRRHRSEISPARPPPKNQTCGGAIVTTKKSQNPQQSRQIRNILGENGDRRKHYAKLEGLDNNMHLHRKEQDNFTASKNPERENTPPQSQQRTWPKFDDPKQTQKTSGASKHRQRCHSGEKRGTRRRDPRFASPYDPHFQEAMYLRLRELQRQGASELRKVKVMRDSDEADDDSDSGLEETKPNERATNRNCSGENSIDDINDQTVSTAVNRSKTTQVLGDSVTHDDEDSAAVHHHHHYHHGIAVAKEIISPEALVSKCIANGANSTRSSILPKASSSECKSGERHHHHYHHHYHHHVDGV